MNKRLMLLGLCALTTQLAGYDAKNFFMKGPGKEVQQTLQQCSYYKITAADSGFDYKCVTLAPKERDWIVQKLSTIAIKDRKTFESIIDDKLIGQLTTPPSAENDTLKQVLTDFKGRTVKKILKTLKKMSTLQKIADVLPQLMRQDY